MPLQHWPDRFINVQAARREAGLIRAHLIGSRLGLSLSPQTALPSNRRLTEHIKKSMTRWRDPKRGKHLRNISPSASQACAMAQTRPFYKAREHPWSSISSASISVILDAQQSSTATIPPNLYRAIAKQWVSGLNSSFTYVYCTRVIITIEAINAFAHTNVAPGVQPVRE